MSGTDCTLKPQAQSVGMNIASYVYSVVVLSLDDEGMEAAMRMLKYAKATRQEDDVWDVVCKFSGGDRDELRREMHLKLLEVADDFYLERIQIYGELGTRGPLLGDLRFNMAGERIDEDMQKAA